MHGGWRTGGEGIDTSRGIWAGNQGNREPMRLECEPCAQSPKANRTGMWEAVVMVGAIENTKGK